MTPTPTGACGTTAGYARHRNRHEKACDECKEAKHHQAVEHPRDGYRFFHDHDTTIDELLSVLHG